MRVVVDVPTDELKVRGIGIPVISQFVYLPAFKLFNPAQDWLAEWREFFGYFFHEVHPKFLVLPLDHPDLPVSSLIQTE